MAILAFQKPDKVVMLEANDKFGKFEFRPLEPGFGVTIGNSLRRILLSSLEGFAINTVKISGVDYPVSARVPLLQSTLEGNELIWSIVDNGERYFIMAGSEGLIFRQFTQRTSGGNPTLYKKNTNTNLTKGSADAANSDDKYITPWEFAYAGEDGQANHKLTLTTKYGINRNFVINGETTPEASTAAASVLTYEYEAVHVNDNANFEEVVRLKYGSDKWLKFEVAAGTPRLVLTTDKNEASVFSWGFLQLEYRLLNSKATENEVTNLIKRHLKDEETYLYVTTPERLNAELYANSKGADYFARY